MSQNSEVEQRKAEVSETKQKEGSGTVPNVTEDEAEEDAGEVKEALHEFEEEKGDWSKSRG